MHNTKFNLTKREQNELFIKFAKAVSVLHNSHEAAQFLKDLLSEAEVLMLARRLQIAELLMDGLSYDQIRSSLKASPGTIARVATWLELYGEGYRTAIKRTGKNKEKNEDFDKPFSKLKRNYPMYFWPQILLEEIVKSANKREKQKLLKVVDQLKEKTQLSKDLEKLLIS